MDERLEKLTDLDKKVNSDDLIYRYEGNTPDLNFDEFDNALALVDKMRDGKISLTDVKKTPKNALYNIETLYKARNEAVKFYDDYSLIMSEAKIKATKGIGLKILTPKQMLQRLPIALAQVKAGNNSESLLNEIRQIVYSLYQSKQITKKLYNNIIKSIQ